jgi:hypothetical protein
VSSVECASIDQDRVWTNYLILEGTRLYDSLVAEGKAASAFEGQVELEVDFRSRLRCLCDIV